MKLSMCFCAAATLAGQAIAQTSFVSSAAGDLDAPTTDEQDALGFQQGSFVVVPIPSQNPTFDTGLALGAGYLFKADEKSANSFIGIGAYGSTNGSRAYGASTSLAFRENRWKFKLTVAEIDLNYDLGLLGVAIPLRQDGEYGSVEFAYGITSELSVGIGARYLSTTITPDFTLGLPPDYQLDFSTEIASTGVVLSWDRRDDTFFSTEGTNVDLSVYHHDIVDTPRDYQKAVLTLDGYYPVGASNVAAARLTGCKATDDAPFFDSCALGSVDKFRGFSVTKNIGLELASLQLSWRGRIGESRFGYEVFAGSGRVYDTFPGAGEAKFRSAGGAGLKYRLTKKFPLDLALDVAVNDDGDNTTYIYVGQRF